MIAIAEPNRLASALDAQIRGSIEFLVAIHKLRNVQMTCRSSSLSLACFLLRVASHLKLVPPRIIVHQKNRAKAWPASRATEADCPPAAGGFGQKRVHVREWKPSMHRVESLAHLPFKV